MSKIFTIRIEKSLYAEIEAERLDEAVRAAWKRWDENPPAEELFIENEYENDEEDE